ncbi:MAG: TetR/AcrR family transcriptional regulator [Methylococcales bacterium]
MTESGERIIDTESELAEDLEPEIINNPSSPTADNPVASAEETEITPSPPDQPEINKKEQQVETDDQDRDRILDASLYLFADKGVYQTSLVDISTQAKLSKASLYKQFQNKEAIADALYCDLMERLEQTIADIDKNNSTSIGCLRSIVEFLLDLTEQAPAVARLLFCPKDMGLANNKPGSERFPVFEQMINILETGMKAGELERVQPRLAYCTFMGILRSAIELELEGELNRSLSQHLSDVWYPIWRALGQNPNRPS